MLLHPSRSASRRTLRPSRSGLDSHPFTFSNFKIKDAEQIRKIRELNLKQLRYYPLRSDGELLEYAAKFDKEFHQFLSNLTKSESKADHD